MEGRKKSNKNINETVTLELEQPILNEDQQTPVVEVRKVPASPTQESLSSISSINTSKSSMSTLLSSEDITPSTLRVAEVVENSKEEINATEINKTPDYLGSGDISVSVEFPQPVKRRGTKTMEDLMVQSPNSPQKNKINAIMEEQNSLAIRLGIKKPENEEEQKFIKEYISQQEKIDGVLNYLILLVKLDVKQNKRGKDYSLDIMEELRLFYVWLQSENFSQADKEFLNKMILSAKTENNKKIDPRNLKKYKILQNIIETHPVPFMLRNYIYGLRACDKLNKSIIITKKTMVSCKTKIKKIAGEYEKKQIKERKKSQKNKSLSKSEEEARKLTNKFLTLDSRITKCEESYNHFLQSKKFQEKEDNEKLELDDIQEKSKQSKFLKKHFATTAKIVNKNISPMHATEKNVDAAAVESYTDCEKVILAATSILHDPETSKKQARLLNKIIAFQMETMLKVFQESFTLKKQLKKEQNEYLFAEQVRNNFGLKVITHNFYNSKDTNLQGSSGESKHINQRAIEQGLEYRSLGNGNFIVHLVKNNSGTAIVLRASEANKDQEQRGIAPDQLVPRVVTSLSTSMTATPFMIVNGVADPLTTQGSFREQIRRNMQISQAFEGCKDLFDVFLDLHAAYTQDAQAINKFQLALIDTVEKLVKFIVELAQENRFMTDLKPRNVLVTTDNKLKVSDVKSYTTNAKELLPEFLAYRDDIQQLSKTFFTEDFLVERNGTRYVNLDVLRRETLIFTLHQLISLNEIGLDTIRDSKTLYSYINTDLNRETQSRTFEEKGRLVKAIPIHALYEGDLGKVVEEITSWMIALLNEDTTLNYILDYLQSDEVLMLINKVKGEMSRSNNNNNNNNFKNDDTFGKTEKTETRRSSFGSS